MLRKSYVYVMAFLVLSLVFVSGLSAVEASTGEIQPDLVETDSFDEIINYIYNYHVNSPSLDVLEEGAIKGMLEALGDPYTSYIPPEDVDSFYDSLEGNYAGIGVILEKQGNFPVAVDVFENSPAELAGMKKKDKIVTIDDKDVTGMTLSEVAEMLRGPEGTEVCVTVNRGQGNLQLRITRAAIIAPTVFSELMRDNTGYINITSFNSHTGSEFKRALTDLRKSGITSLVLDLRGNPGGILPAAVDIAGHFIDKGQTIVTTEDRFGSREVYSSAGTKLAEGLKVAVLVDGMTASASEILAGALSDYGRAVLIGDKTFGKGVVQFLVSLNSGGSLKVTVQRYLTPNGVCIHNNGINPDRKVLTGSLQVSAALQELKEEAVKKISFQLGSHTVYVENDEILCETKPCLIDGSVYLPLRFVLEAFGYEVNWLDIVNSIEAVKGDQKILLSVNDTGVVFKDGVTYLSLDKLVSLNVQYTQSGDSIYIIHNI